MLNEPSSFCSQPSKAGEMLWPLRYDGVCASGEASAAPTISATPASVARSGLVIDLAAPSRVTIACRARRQPLVAWRRRHAAQRAVDEVVVLLHLPHLAPLRHLRLELLLGERDALPEVDEHVGDRAVA